LADLTMDADQASHVAVQVYQSDNAQPQPMYFRISAAGDGQS
jgi:hypothetical protein